MRIQLVAILVLVLSCQNRISQAQEVEGKDLDDLIDQIYSKPTGEQPSTVAPKGPNLQPNNGGTTGGTSTGTTNCNCVPYYLCNNGSINTNGEGIIDIRMNEGQCESYIEVCCDKENVVDKPLTPTPPPVARVGCGHRNPDGIGFRITGDKEHESQFGEFPWMVAVLREETVEGNPQKLNVYQCGGALIHPQVVLTAAHCVSGKDKQFKIRAGEWDTQTKSELFPHQDREVDSIVVHEQYYAGALYNDVALLFLVSPVEIAENVNVVCLPPQGTVIDTARCFATGWGKDIFGKEGKYQVILKKIELPIVPRGPCQDELRKTRLGKFFELHKSFICAGGEAGQDTCKGDGGSPLVCPIVGQDERYVQAGIVAWGIGCGDGGTPGVYANVALFRTWIDQKLTAKNIDGNSYKY